MINLTRITHTRAQLAAAVMLTLLGWACGDGDRLRTPTSPDAPPAPAQPAATYTLSGIVTETTSAGIVAVEGVRVEPRSGQFAMTDQAGFYSISGLPAMSYSVSTNKSGYVTGLTTVTIAGDTQLDMQVNRIVSYTLSGMVFELTPSGRLPLEGVEVYCDSCGSPEGHTFAYTDAAGFYSFSWAFNGVTPLFVTKAGYAIVDPTGTLIDAYGRIRATVDGDTRFDVQLAPK